MAQADNVTKHDAGGSGDYYIPDGYVKTVEKVWLDSYTFASALASGTSLDIAVVPANKKITGVDVYFSVTLAATCMNTAPTISLGYRVGSTTANTTFLNAGESCTSKTDAAFAVLHFSANAGIQTVTSAETYIILYVGRIATTATAGTIKTVVRYT